MGGSCDILHLVPDSANRLRVMLTSALLAIANNCAKFALLKVTRCVCANKI